MSFWNLQPGFDFKGMVLLHSVLQYLSDLYNTIISLSEVIEELAMYRCLSRLTVNVSHFRKCSLVI